MKAERGNTDRFRRDELSSRGDAYESAEKPDGPTRCPVCNASFTGGRWSWKVAPEDAHVVMCPACQRIHDKFPAGYVMIKGQFFAEHRDEIVRLVDNYEQREKAEHPLQRIMAMEDVSGGLQVSTTHTHLARGIAQALQEAYKGDMKLRFSRDENLVRAVWKRDR